MIAIKNPDGKLIPVASKNTPIAFYATDQAAQTAYNNGEIPEGTIVFTEEDAETHNWVKDGANDAYYKVDGNVVEIFGTVTGPTSSYTFPVTFTSEPNVTLGWKPVSGNTLHELINSVSTTSVTFAEAQYGTGARNLTSGSSVYFRVIGFIA